MFSFVVISLKNPEVYRLAVILVVFFMGGEVGE